MTNEQKAAVLTRLHNLIPEETDQTLLGEMIDSAEAFALAYTGRKTLPSQLLHCVGDLAVVDYNRLGTEGERARSEGGESYTYDSAPPRIFTLLNLYRLVRVSGKYYEKQAD